MDGDFDALPDKHRTCVYRVVQEAHDQLRPARAGHGDQHQRRAPATDSSRVSVSDDGVGLDPAPRPNGLGLRGIDERVKELHGTMTIAAQPAGGTTLTVGSAAAGTPRWRCRLRVLLADDHSIVRRGLRGLLEAAGRLGRRRGGRRARGRAAVRGASARTC